MGGFNAQAIHPSLLQIIYRGNKPCGTCNVLLLYDVIVPTRRRLIVQSLSYKLGWWLPSLVQQHKLGNITSFYFPSL